MTRRFVLVLFLASLWAYTRWSSPFLHAAPTVSATASQKVWPISLSYKKQVLQQLAFLHTGAPDVPAVTPVPSHVDRSSPYRDKALELLPSADPLYVLMSLQR